MGSGAESITIEGNRSIKIMLGRGKNLTQDHATTLWLASPTRKSSSNIGLEPFGWSGISGLTPDVGSDWTRW